MAKERVRVNKNDDDEREDDAQDQTETSETESEDEADPADEEDEKPKSKPKAKAKPEPDDEDEDDEVEEAPPSYKREEIGPRVTALAGIDDKPEDDDGKTTLERLDEEPTVQMMFPCNVNVQHEGIMHRFEKGVQEVPESISTHWYLKHNGVKKFKAR